MVVNISAGSVPPKEAMKKAQKSLPIQGPLEHSMSTKTATEYQQLQPHFCEYITCKISAKLARLHYDVLQ